LHDRDTKLAPVKVYRLRLLFVGRDDHRVRRIKQYVLARLREELGTAPRGAQAQLAKRLGVSGAHLSSMLSATPTRQPGEDFRRKVASHWGITYAQLEAIALGEEPPVSMTQPVGGEEPRAMPPNLTTVLATYAWMPELPAELRLIVREQARLHYDYAGEDLPCEEWRRILTGLEREALALLAHRRRSDASVDGEPRRRRAKRA
jgi:transcriptional regulator with XRE-family HTH domain